MAGLSLSTSKGLGKINGCRFTTPTLTRPGGTPLLGMTRKVLVVFRSHFLCDSVNGGSTVLVDQPNTGGGAVVLSVPVKLNLRSGSNTIAFSTGQSSELPMFRLVASALIAPGACSDYAADLDKIIVYTAG